MSDGTVMHDEWEPFNEQADTHGWSDLYFRAFVTAWNRAAKARGDNTRIRSVDDEEGLS